MIYSKNSIFESWFVLFDILISFLRVKKVHALPMKFSEKLLYWLFVVIFSVLSLIINNNVIVAS